MGEPNNISVETDVDRADELFRNYGWGEAVLLAVSEETGTSCECVPHIAAALPGGMGAGEVCGAIAGGVLAIGLVYGEDYPDAIGVLTEEYLTQIEERVGTLHCKEIIGTDISGAMNAEDFKSIARILWVFFIQGKRKICNGVVRSAVQVVLEQQREWEA